MLAHKMAYKLSQTRKDGTIPFILPDGKTQVTVEYEGDGKPQRIDTIVISTQHTDGSLPLLMHPLVENVITPVLQEARTSRGSTSTPTTCTSILPGVLCRVALRQTPA